MIEMDERINTFGHQVLITYTMIEGKVLSAGFMNRETSATLRFLNLVYRGFLVKYLDTRDHDAKQFLGVCIDHFEDISKDRYGFLDPYLERGEDWFIDRLFRTDESGLPDQFRDVTKMTEPLGAREQSSERVKPPSADFRESRNERRAQARKFF